MGQFVSLISGVGFLGFPKASTLMKLRKSVTLPMLENSRRLVRQHHPNSSASLDNDTETPCRDVRIHPAEARVRTRRRSIGTPVVASPCKKPTSRISTEEYPDYPGLESVIKSHGKFPKFLRKITKTNLNDKNNMRLEIPFAFVNTHWEELQERVTLLERGGHPRQVELQVTIYGNQRRVFLSRGWRSLFLQNGCRKGDVLVFFLVGASTFVVRKFSRVPKRS